MCYQSPASELYDEIIDLYSDSYESSGDPQCLEDLFLYIERAKARVLAELLADQPIAKPLGTPEDLIRRESSLLLELKRLQGSLEGVGSSFEVVAKLDQVQAELQQVWTAIAASDPDQGPEYVSIRTAQPVSAREIQDVIASADTRKIALVEFYVTPRRLISLCLFSYKAGLQYHSAHIDSDELRRSALVNPDDPPSIDLRLPYWLLDFPALTVAPILEAVRDCDLVCFVPHGVLHSLPLHAFGGNGDHAPIIATVPVSYIPSASLLRFCLRRRRVTRGDSLVVGAPIRTDQPPIPHSDSEAKEVAALLNTQALTGSQATLKAIEGKCRTAEYIHLACHCTFSGKDPLDSALLLTDGDLTARLMFSWRIGPELCVLSACQSGISRVQAGDELIGLVRALLFAGAPAVLVSLWNAYDIGTSEIMHHFYNERIREHRTKADALAHALRFEFQKGAPIAHWAPFVLVGDWRY